MSRRPTLVIALGAVLALAGCGLPFQGPTSSRMTTSFQAQDLDRNATPTKSFQLPKFALRAPDPWVSNSSAELHVGPADNLAALKDLITHARKTLFIEVFNFADDSYGDQIAPLVIDAAKRGVKVKFLCDYIGSRFGGAKKLGDEMAAVGVDFRFWDPRLILQADQKRGINITHRKVYCADGDRALTGGVNIKAPFDTTTHDLLVDFHGEEAAQLHQEFANDWASNGDGQVAYDPLVPSATYGNVRTRTMVTSPVEGRFEAQAGIYQAIENAQHEVVIENQYLWDQGIMDRLLAAAQRGVKIRTIVPGKDDNKAFRYLHKVALNAIIKAGGECRLYNGLNGTAHVHTKYFSVDDQWACFGSVNGDTRALMDNQELDVATTDPGLISALKTRLFETDWQSATVVYHFDPAPFYTGPFTAIWQVLDYYM